MSANLSRTLSSASVVSSTGQSVTHPRPSKKAKSTTSSAFQTADVDDSASVIAVSDDEAKGSAPGDEAKKSAPDLHQELGMFLT